MSDLMFDTRTGEIVSDSDDIELVPLNLAALDEEELAALIPTPQQCAIALIIARARIRNAPKVLRDASKRVRAAKRQLAVARGYARGDVIGRDAETRKLIAESHASVITAMEELDIAEIALEYGRETRKSLTEDIEILRSLNANFRGEHS